MFKTSIRRLERNNRSTSNRSIKSKRENEGYPVKITSMVIGCMGGGTNKLRKLIAKVQEISKKEMTRIWE